MKIYQIVSNISLFSPILPILVGIFRLDRIKLENKILILFLVVTFTIDIASSMVIKIYWVNLAFMHSYIFLEFLFVMIIISLGQDSQRMKKYFQVIYLLYIIFWICAKLTFEPFNGLYSITATISQVILVLGAGYTLFVVIGNSTQPLFSMQRFWVLLSFVLYYTGTLALVALQGILVNYSREDVILAASLNWSLKIFFNLLLTIGFLCPQTQQ